MGSTKCLILAMLLKLFSNSLFGKLMTSPLNYNSNVHLCNEKNDFIKRLCKQNFISLQILDKNKVLIFSRKNKVKLQSPIYVGFIILEFARLINYNIYYDLLLKVYSSQF